MNKTLLVSLFSFVLLLLVQTSVAQVAHVDILSPSVPKPPQDTLQTSAPAYQGYRLHLTRFTILKKKKKSIKLKYTAINTGREALNLGKKNVPPQVLIDFDDDFAESDLAAYETEIRKQILAEELKLAPGELAFNRSFKLSLSKDKIKKAEKEEKEEIGFTLNVGSGSTDQNYLDKNFCSDLSFDTIYVLKKSKHSITLGYTLSNYGKGPATMFGTKPVEADNVAIKAYLAATGKLTRGSLAIGGAFITKGLKDEKGLLQPQESYTGTIKLNLREMTRFTPHIVLDLDVYGTLRECNERNNTRAILIGEALDFNNN
ncbi:MAG: hypothetical protein AB8G15_12035 [Saprospiraceae bacterium]